MSRASKVLEKIEAAGGVLETQKTGDPLEISTVLKDQRTVAKAKKAIADNYSDNLVYKGVEFFDTIYHGIIIPAARKALEIEDGDQESYLGYIPATDTFVSGWDTLEPADDSVKGAAGNVAFIKVKGNSGKVTAISGDAGDMMYGVIGHSYKTLKAKHKGLIDIRLD